MTHKQTVLDPSSLILRFAPQVTLRIKILYNLTGWNRKEFCQEKRLEIYLGAPSAHDSWRLISQTFKKINHPVINSAHTLGHKQFLLVIWWQLQWHLFTLCSISGLQHKERCLSWHEAQCLGHWRTEEDQAILEKIPGKHGPFGEWTEKPVKAADVLDLIHFCDSIFVVLDLCHWQCR